MSTQQELVRGRVEDEAPVTAAVERLVKRRVHDRHLLGRLAWTCMTLLTMAFAWAFLTLLVLSEAHWTIAGLVGVDGGAMLAGLLVLLIVWIPD